MANLNLKSLIGKLNMTSCLALEKATGLCLSRGHDNIELEHWLLSLIDNKKSALFILLQQAGCDLTRIKNDINHSLEKFTIGNEQTPAISHRIIDLINEAWVLASLNESLEIINSGILLQALFQNHLLAQISLSISPELRKFNQQHSPHLYELALKQSEEWPMQISENESSPHSALAEFTINLNQLAHQDKIDAVVGREFEIRQVIDILGRRRQNNAILIGDPGVGKTAIVEGLALRIVERDVPDNLKNVVIHSLDLGLLQAGAGIKGEFESRLKKLIQEIKQSPHPIILFIDEAHTLIGSNSVFLQNDAANLLKPALARGELRSIAATTWQEYKQYFEKDAALTRRFQAVKIEEPDALTATHMLRSLTTRFEKHHQLSILDSAIQSAVLLSHRYLTDRQLPDKAISVLDTACSRVAGKQCTTPVAIDNRKKTLAMLKTEHLKLVNEQKQGHNHHRRMNKLASGITKQKRQIQKLQKRWLHEKQIVTELLTLSDGQNATRRFKKLNKKLHKQQPLIQAFVDEQSIAEVIADWTGIPVGKMLNDEIQQTIDLSQQLQTRVIGQNHAIEKIAASIQVSKAKLSDPKKPIGVFLFVGPSGVGKTETAIALSEHLFGSAEKMTTINMSEFKEAHRVSLLTGAPPGYIGYGEGGMLTEAIRRKPYSIVLLDEMEKAHPSAQDIFYQVFDKGMIKDGQGRDIHFNNTLIIMTSNAAGEEIAKQNKASSNLLDINIYQQLLKYFKPAFLGRVTIIPYLLLTNDALNKVLIMKLQKIKNRLQAEYGIETIFESEVNEFILQQCNQSDYGARQIDNILTQSISTELSSFILNHLLNQKLPIKIIVSLNKQRKFHYQAFFKKTKSSIANG